jgi:hypothetical protein
MAYYLNAGMLAKQYETIAAYPRRYTLRQLSNIRRDPPHVIACELGL